MAYPRHNAPETIDPENVRGLLLCLPADLVPILRGQIRVLQYNYAYNRGTGDTELTQDYFRELINQMDNGCCDIVADCITNSEAVQSAIDFYLDNSSNTIRTINTRITDLENIVATAVIQDDCDSRRWAGILQVVNRLNENNIDFLQVLADDLTDIFTRVENILEAIPVFGDAIEIATGAEGWLGFAQSIAQDALDEYEAEDSTALREQFACDIFCATSGCEVTIDDFITAVIDRLPQDIITLGLEALKDVVNIILGGSNATDNYYWLCYLAQLYTLKLTTAWFNFDHVGFTVEYARGSNSPNTDWELLCGCHLPDPVLPLVITFDEMSGNGWELFLDEINGVTPTITTKNNADASMINPVLTGGSNGNARYNGCRIVFDSPQDISNVSFDIALRNVSTTEITRVKVFFDDVAVYSTIWNLSRSGRNISLSLSGTAVSEVRLETSVSSFKNLVNDIDNLTIEGV
jgi:hypothetical protein